MVVKIPMTVEGLKATKVLSSEGIKVNVTLIFSANQALLAARAGAAYVSPFLGRLDDISQPDGKAQFILDTIAFFNREYDYTLSPGVTPSTKDYVGYFLFEKKRGLCVHFASAAVMIFRCTGIPARYVEGFVVPESLYTQQADYRRQARHCIKSE